MEENAKVKMSFGKRAENFWYHYKWHTVAAIVAVAIITVCALQMCSRQTFDNYLLYAGGYGISRNDKDGNAEYPTFLKSMEKVSRDTDGNGELLTSFQDLYTPAPEEMTGSGADAGGFAIGNFDRLKYELISGSDYYVCLLSEYVYTSYREFDGYRVFTPISPYTKEGAEYEYYDEYAIYLHSTDFGELSGFKNLPKDTLIVLRALSPASEAVGRDEHREGFAAGEELLRSILAYEKK